MNSNTVSKFNKFLRQALALSFLSLSCAVLAQQGQLVPILSQQGQLVPVPTPIGEPQRYAFPEGQQPPGTTDSEQRAEYILEPVPVRSGEAPRYNLVQVSGGSGNGLGSPPASHPVYVQSPTSGNALIGPSGRLASPSVHVRSPTSGNIRSSLNRPLDSLPRYPQSTTSSNSRRGSGGNSNNETFGLFGISSALRTVDVANLSKADVVLTESVDVLWFGYGWSGSAVGVDLSFGIGGANTQLVINGAETPFSQAGTLLSRMKTPFSEADVLSSRLDLRLLPRSFVQPFVTVERQLVGADLSDSQAPRRYVTYSGIGLRFRLSSGIALSVASYEDSPDRKVDRTVYNRAQLDFSF